MNLLVLLGVVAFLLAILGIAGLIATSLVVEIILIVLGVALVLWGTGRLRT